jgi:hypothetical protein
VEEVQHAQNHPISGGDAKDKRRHNGEQQQERKHKCGHKFFSFDAPK